MPHHPLRGLLLITFMCTRKAGDLSSLILKLALVNHNENELETTYPPPYMQPHNGGEPYAYELHTDESFACQSSFRYLKFTRFRFKG